MQPEVTRHRVEFYMLLLTAACGSVAGVPARAQTVIDPIVLTASPIVPRSDEGSPSLLDQAFVAVTTMTQQQLQREGAGTLGNLLFDKPGIIGSTYAPGASRPIIRGLDNFRVRVQENGTSSMDV